jgi:O-antigen/teichoic acid export membrane protein
MRSGLFWRRSGAAAGFYVSAALGFLGTTVIAANAFSAQVFGLYAIVLAAAGFFQSFLDVTVEEALIKFGFRYQTREDWGRLRRLFSRALLVKLVGALLAAGALLLLAPLASSVFGRSGLERPLAIAALLPLAQFCEGPAGVALILRGRYDLRSYFLVVSMALRLGGIAVGSRFGLWQTILGMVVAQVVATSAISVAGRLAFSRYPRASVRPLGEDRRGILSFVLQSSAPSGVSWQSTPHATQVLGAVASPLQAGWFRLAQSPQQALASLSAPVRIILLTEQTRDWERGTRQTVFAGIRRYTLGAVLIGLVLLPPVIWLAPHLIRIFFGGTKNLGATNAMRLLLIAAGLRFVYGWTKSFPVSIGRPKLRIWTHGLETAVLIPLTAAFGSFWGASGAAVAVICSALAYCAYWTFLFLRIRREPSTQEVVDVSSAELETAAAEAEALA